MSFSSGGEIPNNASDFYEQAFSALFKEHDASKGVYIREKHCKLEYLDFKRILAHVCLKSFLASDYSFTKDTILKYIDNAKKKCCLPVSFTAESFLKDLTDTVCMLVKDGTKYVYIHRSFQEYFAAYYTSLLSDDDQKRMFDSLDDDRDWIGLSAYLSFLKLLEPNRYYPTIIYPYFAPIIEKCSGKEESLNLIMSIYTGIRKKDEDCHYSFLVSSIKTHTLFYSIDDSAKTLIPRKRNMDEADRFFEKNHANGPQIINIRTVYHLPGGKEFIESFFADIISRYSFLKKKIEDEGKRKAKTSSFIDEL